MTGAGSARRHGDDSGLVVPSERLVVVSNRLPLALKRRGGRWRTERSMGGLATAMGPLLERTQGIWIGWPGDGLGAVDVEREEILARWRTEERCIGVDLPPEIVNRYYEGFSNRVLWPLFHHFPSRMAFQPEGWSAYVDANRRFRDAVVEHLEPGDLVWVHDYHLMLLPRLMREAVPEARVGFFLHIPFPSSEVFRVLPRRTELLDGLLGADYVAFHTHSHLQHFRNSLFRILGIESRMDRVEVRGRAVRLEALPIGIAPAEFTALVESDPEVAVRMSALEARFGRRQILLAVDRLDYTKGIPERLGAFRRLLKRAPHLQGQVVLVQVAVPSREKIPEYAGLGRRVNEMVGALNGEFETADWTPVIYMRRSISRAELVALYASAALGWVTPLRDGMNLVAKEYVACQRDRTGSLVLSEFAGAAAEMGEAFLVNPYDEEGTAAVVEEALALPVEERAERMRALYRRVLRNDVFTWGERFVDSLRAAARSRVDRGGRPEWLDVERLLGCFRAADRRLLLLDYDGTLAPIARSPRQAVPPSGLIQLLTRLAGHPGNQLALVSGRARSDLDNWLGGIPRLWLAAEHGALSRAPGGTAWESLNQNVSVDWKNRVRPVFEHWADRVPGSIVEEKELSLVWHYRMADPQFGEWLANELLSNLEGLLAGTGLTAVRGHRSVEVRFTWANKGEFASRLLAREGEFDIIVAFGDDRTDEDLFRSLPSSAWTVRVGNGISQARFRLPDSRAVLDLLARLADVESTVSAASD